VDKSSEEALWVVFDDLPLPPSQPNLPLVLSAGGVLREEARELLRRHAEHDRCPSVPYLGPHEVALEQLAHCHATLINDARIARIEHDAQYENSASVLREAPVSEVHGEEIAVRPSQVIVLMTRSPASGAGHGR
jgi:hypothetical protein